MIRRDNLPHEKVHCSRPDPLPAVFPRDEKMPEIHRRIRLKTEHGVAHWLRIDLEDDPAQRPARQPVSHPHFEFLRSHLVAMPLVPDELKIPRSEEC